MSSVTLEGLGKRYDDVDVVKGVDLRIGEGEFVVLLGPSGCGKTTTLRMIAGFTEPTTGVVRIGGETVNRLPPRARNLGMVFQDYALFPNMTVGDNIGFGLVERRAARDKVRARVQEMLRLIRMEEGFAGRYPSELSGGQQQRVALARALAYEPKVLLMDEPLGALDQKLRDEMQREFARIQRTLGITTIFVTHDQQEAMMLADRIVVMNAGAIEQAGRPEELYGHPATLFIARFIGRSNVLDGRIERRNGDAAVMRSRNGDLIWGRARDGLREGEDAFCIVRPERMHLADGPGGNTGDLSNEVTARLLRRSFLGNSIDLILEDRSGREIIVEQAAGASEPPGGADLTVRFARDDTLLFPAARPPAVR